MNSASGGREKLEGARILIHEVSARDGLQNEKTILSLKDKLLLLDRLCGMKPASIEVTSFGNVSFSYPLNSCTYP